MDQSKPTDNNCDPLKDLGDGSVKSCDPTLNRQEFIRLVIKRSLLAGAILAAPKIVDKFIIAQPAEAMAMTSTHPGQPMETG